MLCRRDELLEPAMNLTTISWFVYLLPSPCSDYIMQVSDLGWVGCYVVKRSGSQMVNVFQKLNNFLLIVTNCNFIDHFVYLKLGLSLKGESTD
jgi:hypothetical protein